MSFWGLTLESGKRYAQKVESGFHVSMAALDTKTAGDNDVSVMATVEKNDFLLCTLSKQRVPQQRTDLIFQTGEEIAFTTKGKGVVYLTGYLIPEDDFSMTPSDEEFDEEGEDSVMEVANELKKRKGETPNTTVEKKKPKLTPGPKKVQPAKDDSDDSDEMGEEEESEDSSDNEMIDDEAESGEEEEDEEEEGGGDFWKGAAVDDSEEESEDEEYESVSDEDEEEKEVEVATTPLSKSQKKREKKKQAMLNKTPVINGQGTPKEQQSGKKNDKQDKGQTPKSQAQTPKQGQTPKEKGQTPKTTLESPQKKQLAGGVQIEDTLVGNGPVAKPGKMVSVYYTGRLKSNNKMFDSSTKGAGFQFRLGQNEVIKGWDVGLAGMKVGGKRKIVCPPHMAYGVKGAPPSIPPNSALVFEVELRKIS